MYSIHFYHSPRESEEYVFTGIGLCVCLSVTTITKKDCGRICAKFYGKVPRGKGKTKFVFHYNRQRDVEVTVKKLRVISQNA